MKDLHEFIDFVKHDYPEEIRIIDEEMEMDYGPTAIAMESEKEKNQMLLFTNVKGSPFPIVTNVFGTRKRIALAIGSTVDEFYSIWDKRMHKLVEPKVVKSGPVKENLMTGKEVDLSKLPTFKHFEQDAGKYVTAGVVVAKDPETGIRNLSYHRLQLVRKNKFRTSLHSRGHLWRIYSKVEKLNQPLEVAIFIGAHPSILIAAAAKVGMDVDEYEIAGALMQEPVQLVKCETMDLEVPAFSEIVLEGEIPPFIREDEGPFGEYTGYAAGRSTNNVLNVRAITFRNDAIYQSIVPGNSSEHLLLGRVSKEAHILRRMREAIPNLKNINWPRSGTHFFAYLSLSEPIDDGQANHAAILLLGLDSYLKLVVVVDEDIDIYNEQEVLWAIATRMQPDRDVNIIKNVFCNRLDPSAYGEGTSAKIIIDATKKKGWALDRLTIPKNAKEKSARIIKNTGDRPLFRQSATI